MSSTSGGGWQLVARATAGSPVLAAMAVFCLSALALLLTQVAVTITSLGEAGYPDGYVLYDILRYLEAGSAYRDLSSPPYTPSMYGPLTYRLLAIPDQLVRLGNPFLGPRLMVFLCFLGCVGLCASIARRLTGSWLGGAWGALFAASFLSMGSWVLRLRGDFAAILCGLAAVRLLISGSTGTLVLAGVLAGTAPLFKQTYVSILLAGSMWLMLQRRWGQVATFSLAGVGTVVLGYLLFLVLEPRMLENFRALQPVLPHYRGVLRLASRAAGEPVLLLALATALITGRAMASHLRLVTLAAAVSGAVATVTAVHVGANVNYYFEMLLLAAPVAAWGLLAYARQDRGQALFYSTMLSAVVLVSFALPNVLRVREMALGELSGADRARANRHWVALQRALEGREVLALVPRVAAMQEAPFMTEPFFHALQEQAGKNDEHDLLGRIGRQEFDGIVTTIEPDNFRTVEYPSPTQSEAIDRSYRPFCTMLGLEVHLPAESSSGSAGLAGALTGAGCRPSSAS